MELSILDWIVLGKIAVVPKLPNVNIIRCHNVYFLAQRKREQIHLRNVATPLNVTVYHHGDTFKYCKVKAHVQTVRALNKLDMDFRSFTFVTMGSNSCVRRL